MKLNTTIILVLFLLATISCKKSYDSGTSEVLERSTFSLAASGANSSNDTFISFKPSASYQMLFTDRFDANNIDQNNNWWNYRTESIYYWYTGFTGYSRSANVTVGASKLNISFDKTNNQYFGGGIISDKEFGYGYYEARVKVYTHQYGFHQSFWSKSPQVEVDGFELDSKHNEFRNCKHRWLPSHIKYNLTSTQHANAAYIGNNMAGSSWQASDGVWKTLGYEWLPDRVNFFVDGQLNNTFFNTDSYGNNLDVYAPSNLYITGLPLQLQQSDVLPTIPETYASMQVENVAYSAKRLPSVNLLGNNSFELLYNQNANAATAPNAPSWSDYAITYNGSTLYGGVITNTNIVNNDVKVGSYALNLVNSAVARQYLYYLPNGKYTLSAWIKCSNPNFSLGDKVQMIVLGGDYQLLNAKLNNTVDGAVSKRTVQYQQSSWININIEDIEVVDNTARIAFYVKFNSGRTGWLQVDDVKFYAQ